MVGNSDYRVRNVCEYRSSPGSNPQGLGQVFGTGGQNYDACVSRLGKQFFKEDLQDALAECQSTRLREVLHWRLLCRRHFRAGSTSSSSWGAGNRDQGWSSHHCAGAVFVGWYSDCEYSCKRHRWGNYPINPKHWVMRTRACHPNTTLAPRETLKNW